MRFPWFLSSPLFDEEDGASGTATLAPGDPFEHDHEEAEVEDKPVVESDSDKRIKALEAEVASERRKREESEADARHWSQQARRPAERAQPIVEAEDLAEPEVTEKADAFLDAVSSKGMAALKERGVITKTDLREAVKEVLSEVDEKITGTVQATRLDAQMNEEFPELMREAEAVDSASKKGGRVETSEHYQRSAAIVAQMIATDKKLAESPAIMLIAARQAKAELKAEGKAKPAEKEDKGGEVETRQVSRRSRIEAQRPAREVRDDETGGGRGELNATQREVASRLHVTEADFKKQQGKIQEGRRRG